MELIGLKVLNKFVCSQEESFSNTTKELSTLNFVSSLTLLHFTFFITKCIIYSFTIFVGLTPWIYKLHENRDLCFIPDSVLASWSVPVSEVTEKICGIYIYMCVCKWISYCNFLTVFPMLSVQLPDSVYQLNGICGIFRVYLKLIYYSFSIQAFMQNHVWCN